jgi:hypothetical protein
LWLIDHGAALYFHHSWDEYLERAASKFPQIKEQVLLPWASEIEAADAELSTRLTSESIGRIVEQIPDSWLVKDSPFASAEEHRAAYREYFARRLEAPRAWVEEAVHARTLLV